MFIDISISLSDETPVYPGDPPIDIKQLFTVAKDGVSIHQYNFAGHCSTHMDAPAHMFTNGKSLADFPVDKFTGEGIVIDAKGYKSIDIDILNNIKIGKNKIVLFRTDYSRKIDEKNYFENYPVISEKLAQRLVDMQVKMIGIDWPSPDYPPYPAHKALLKNDILIVENLCNLDKLAGKKFKLYAFPVKVATDGVPTRVIAEII